MNLTMNHDYEDELIDPDVIADMSDSMPTKVPLRRYLTAMSNLRAKNYSYAEIAAWMSKQLKVDITRSQVAYALMVLIIMKLKKIFLNYFASLNFLDSGDSMEILPK